MVLLLEKLIFKLENHIHHNHHHSEALSSASLQAFRSDVSNSLNQLSKPGSEFLSLVWIQQCFEVINLVNKSFAKLVVHIDYPMNKWEAASIEEYLNYSLNILDLLNSISSSLSHLSRARLSLYHALSLIQNSPSLREIRSKDFNFKVEGVEENEERHCSEKESVIHQALIVTKSIGFWVCGVVLSGLSINIKPYLEMRRLANGFIDSSSLKAVDSSFFEEMTEKGGFVKELREINDAVAYLNGNTDHDAAKKLQTRLEMLEKMLEDIKKEANGLFSEALAGRNEMIDYLRQQKE